MELKRTIDTARILEAARQKRRYHSLQAAGERLGSKVHRFPLPLRILLENLLRHQDEAEVTEAEIDALARWPESAGEQIPFYPSRVLAPDSSGLPLLADLAALRAAAAKRGVAAASINPEIPLDVVVDHSVAVDEAGTSTAAARNLQLEFERNGARYAFLRWAQQAFDNLRIVPPGKGILHQINLEVLTPIIFGKDIEGEPWAFPDSLIGCDSHTPMVNGLGVFAFGVGGIEALSALLGDPVPLSLPRVVGCRLKGTPRPGILCTDLALTICEQLSRHRLDGAVVEFFGSGLDALPAPDRTTIANMAPEHGAMMAFFPIDQATLAFLEATNRSAAVIKLVEVYAKMQGLWRDDASEHIFDEVIEIDLDEVAPVLAGPSLPSQRRTLSEVPASLPRKPENGHDRLDDGSIVIAAITSCTNTANPGAMIAAGLLARNARQKGLATKPWVKASLSPGSRAVTNYLSDFGLLDFLEELGFALAGYGCMTCVGGSGPLAPEIENAIKERDLEVGAVLSGNRNFAGRIHPLVRNGYLAAPPLVVAYALAGTLDIDLEKEPLSSGDDGSIVYLRDIWPAPEEVASFSQKALSPERFRAIGETLFTPPPEWQELVSAEGPLFPFEAEHDSLREPPFFQGQAQEALSFENDIHGAKTLVVLGDQITTDHISPAGRIAADSPAGRYLADCGLPQAKFGTYLLRRTNHEVMVRGTFANPRIVNHLARGEEGGLTPDPHSKGLISVYDAAQVYAEEKRPLVVIAGENYGCGSSRDWAAKGTRLLGVRAVVARSFGYIHRANLVGMGVLPLRFADPVEVESLGLDGREEIDILDLCEGLSPGGRLTLLIRRENARSEMIPLICGLATTAEAERLCQGGILPTVLSRLVSSVSSEQPQD